MKIMIQGCMEIQFPQQHTSKISKGVLRHVKKTTLSAMGASFGRNNT